MAGFGPMGGGMPPGGGPAPGGAAPPPQPPMPPPPAMAAPQPGAPSPGLAAGLAGLPMPALGVPSVFQDVSQDLPRHWQNIDAGSRIIKRALKTGGFYQQPEARAALDQIAKDLDELVQRYGMAQPTMGPQVPQPTAGTAEPAAEPGADAE